VPQGPARLLDPRLELVGFIGRDHELASLVEWCEDDHSTRLRLITGPGGVGKTRLAVELTTRMTTVGWRCERIADGREGEAIAALRAVTRGRALLVVDYAETRVRLGQMLTALVGDDGIDVRVLLLARSAGEWWDRLGIGVPAVWDLVQAARSAELILSPAIDADVSDAEVVAQAVRSFARKLKLPERAVQIYDDDDDAPRRVLDLHVAALVAVLDKSSDGTILVDIRTVLRELIRHEQHFWYDSARMYGLSDGPAGMPTRILRQIVAVGSLLGAANEEEARELARRVPGLSPSAKVAAWLRELYPPRQGELEWLGPMQPDRLAERHVVGELVGSPKFAESCLTSLHGMQARNAVILLARASSDDIDAEVLLSQILPKVSGFVTDLDAPLEVLTAIFNVIPYPTAILASAAVGLAERIIGLLPDDTPPAVRAYWSNSLGIGLAQLGRPVQALPLFQEALAIRRELVANPGHEEYEHDDLADSLINLGIVFSELGRPVDALPVTQEAVEIRRELAATNPERYGPDLAESLDNLGSQLAALGGVTDALPVIQEAIEIYRDLTAFHSDRYHPGLASSLDNLGIRFAEPGQSAEALPATQEAVKIRRELAAANPDRFGSDLAYSLSNLAAVLSELGRPADALPITQEAVDIRRELAATNPDRYRSDLAGSLADLGIRFRELGRSADALAVTQEAVEIRRELIETHSNLRLIDLAGLLTNLGALLCEFGRLDDALTVTREAVEIRRELAATNPDRHRGDLAPSLDNLGVIMAQLHRLGDAMPVMQEAADIYRELASANPNAYRKDFAAALNNLGVLFTELGRPAEALRIIQEAIEIHRELAATDPARNRQGLVASLTNLVQILVSLGRKVEADRARIEAAKLRGLIT